MNAETVPKDEVDLLAQALYAKDKTPDESGWLWEDHSEKIHDIWRGYARRFLDSRWLTAHDAQVRRDATREALLSAADEFVAGNADILHAPIRPGTIAMRLQEMARRADTAPEPAVAWTVQGSNAGPWVHLDGTACPTYWASKPKPDAAEHWWCTEHEQYVEPAARAVPTEGEACGCPPCPGRGNDGHGMTHCAECCWGTGVEADPTCETHGEAAYAPTPPTASRHVPERGYRGQDTVALEDATPPTLGHSETGSDHVVASPIETRTVGDDEVEVLAEWLWDALPQPVASDFDPAPWSEAGDSSREKMRSQAKAALDWLASRTPSPSVDGAALVESIEALCASPDGEREWSNQGRSGWTLVVDVSRLRAALARAAAGEGR